MTMLRRRALLPATLALAAPRLASAQSFPARPVTILVGYPAGGAVDTVARIVADRLRVELDQQVVIDNRPGASGLTASGVVRRAAPDGHTLVIATNGTMAINAQLMRTPPFDPVADFTPVGMVAINDGVIVVHPDFPARNLAEFVAAVRAAPGRFFYASSGIGGSTHLGAELVMQTVGLRMNHVPYQGDGPALVDVMAGRVPIMSSVMPSVADHIRAGRVRPIAALGEGRFPGFPDLPAIGESYPGLTAFAWLALFGPRGLPEAVVRTLNGALRQALSHEPTLARLANVGSVGRAGSPQELQALLAGDLAKWKAVIERIGLEPS
jgi:tripartite-type tricarboxylate transporter receptor subunit TctC